MAKTSGRIIPILPLTPKQLKGWVAKQPSDTKNWIKSSGFTADTKSFCLVPGKNGVVSKVLVGVSEPLDIWSLAHLPTELPVARYRLEGKLNKDTANKLVIGWELGNYGYNDFKYTDSKKKVKKRLASLEAPKSCDNSQIKNTVEAIYLVRDLINTPANVMNPPALAAAAKKLAQKHKATCKIMVGDVLLKQNYPAIHTVGRASDQPPRLVDIKWGNARHPKVTLVGKGITFDTGGLDIKPSSNMLLMKKDMGGAACVLGLASMIMSHNLPVRLRVLLPIAENSVSANSYRPSDIIATRKGISVEVGNTDAEGRLVLCDALAEADSEKPDLLIDMATLTGASRVALGTDIPSFFTNDDALAAAVDKSSISATDPLWRMPLWPDYREILDSAVADINSAPGHIYAGAITAALFLQEFVTNCKSWMHIDLMAWNLNTRPGRPAGGEAQGIRSLFALLQSRYGEK